MLLKRKVIEGTMTNFSHRLKELSTDISNFSLNTHDFFKSHNFEDISLSSRLQQLARGLRQPKPETKCRISLF